jgi:hypothetical protein
MATSGTYGWTPQFDEIIADAFERIGVDPQGLTHRHVTSALRSVNFILSQWGNLTLPWRRDTVDYTAVDGAFTIATGAGVLAVIDATLMRDGVEVPLMMISKEDYEAIPDKDQEGRPDRFFPDLITPTPTIYIWPAFENSTDVLRYTRLRRAQRAVGMAEDADVPQGWNNALAAGLAVFLAEKFAPERLEEKMALAGPALESARQGSRDRSDWQILPGRRRHR